MTSSNDIQFLLGELSELSFKYLGKLDLEILDSPINSDGSIVPTNNNTITIKVNLKDLVILFEDAIIFKNTSGKNYTRIKNKVFGD